MMIDYILEQPAVIEAAIRASSALVGNFCSFFSRCAPDRLYLIASGTSYNACRAAERFIEEVLGLEVTVAPPSRVPIIWGERPLIVLVSQGGNSINILNAQNELSNHKCIGITANIRGALLSNGMPYQLIPCGDENVGPKTKGYTATIIILYLIALHCAIRANKVTPERFDAWMLDLLTMCSQMRGNLKLAEDWIRNNKESMKKIGTCFVVGKGQSAAIAMEASLKLTETVLVATMPFDFEEFLHGPACAIREGIAGVYLLPDERDSDYKRFLKVVEMHRKVSNQVYTVGWSEQLEDTRDCVLLPPTNRHNVPFGLVLPFQLMGALLPEMFGLVDKGMDYFKALDKELSIKTELEF